MKSQIRIKIEEILGRDFPHVYVDATDKHKKKNYRMKFLTLTKATHEEANEIFNLPHVYRVGYWKGRMRQNRSWTSPKFDNTYAGITVYFDCKPSLIKLACEHNWMYIHLPDFTTADVCTKCRKIQTF